MLALLLVCSGAQAQQNDSFEKDRKAILQMAGDFKVSFHFQETIALKGDYQPKEKPYTTDAFETVKVVEDSGKKIVLQHLLQVGDTVVKHWAQTWSYEDGTSFKFQGDRNWVQCKQENVRGGWTQQVTEVTDEPRYEGFGHWVHTTDSSEWTSDITNRPLPRREYTTRKDYDLLVVTNRHTVTPKGWYHEQDNTKWVKNRGKNYPLCREVGLNRYERVEGHDFAKANQYWKETEGLWREVRKFWDQTMAQNTEVKLRKDVGGSSMSKILTPFEEQAKQGKPIKFEELEAAMKPFVTTEEAKASAADTDR